MHRPENITKMDADEEMAFNQRLVEARKRCELFTAKRIKEEEAVTRMYHEKRLKTVIEDMTNNSQNGTKVMLLPSPESKVLLNTTNINPWYCILFHTVFFNL